MKQRIIYKVDKKNNHSKEINIGKGFVIFGGFAFVVGIFIPFISTLVTANLELVHGVGINGIKEYHLSYYAIACFILDIFFILLGFSSFFDRLINKYYYPVRILGEKNEKRHRTNY